MGFEIKKEDLPGGDVLLYAIEDGGRIFNKWIIQKAELDKVAEEALLMSYLPKQTLTKFLLKHTGKTWGGVNEEGMRFVEVISRLVALGHKSASSVQYATGRMDTSEEPKVADLKSLVEQAKKALGDGKKRRL